MHTIVASPDTPLKEQSIASTIEDLRDELELVGYVTSHDLQAPLRVIQSCTEELRKHPALMSSDTGGATLQMLSSETVRLKTLMQGMLDYVRLQTFVPALSKLDSKEIVTAAVAVLETEIKTAGASVTYDALPAVKGHRGRLTRLFIHLIENAVKFRGKTPPRIRISARPKGDFWEFCVEDNGIGIDREHHSIVFMLFQRLHTAEAYPGHGIGLALAHKIVEAHGGTLRVDSALQAGSRFYFTLPAAPV